MLDWRDAGGSSLGSTLDSAGFVVVQQRGLHCGDAPQFPSVSTFAAALVLMLLKGKNSDGTREWSS